MKKFLVLALCAFSLVSCNRPPISSRDFADLTYDMFLVRYYVENNPDVELSADSLSVYGALLEKYGYSVDDYKATVEYYVSNPDECARFYKDIQRRIKLRKNELEKQVKADNEARAASTAGTVTLDDISDIEIQELPEDFLKRLFP